MKKKLLKHSLETFSQVSIELEIIVRLFTGLIIRIYISLSDTALTFKLLYIWYTVIISTIKVDVGG